MGFVYWKHNVDRWIFFNRNLQWLILLFNGRLYITKKEKVRFQKIYTQPNLLKKATKTNRSLRDEWSSIKYNALFVLTLIFSVKWIIF